MEADPIGSTERRYHQAEMNRTKPRVCQTKHFQCTHDESEIESHDGRWNRLSDTLETWQRPPTLQ